MPLCKSTTPNLRGITFMHNLRSLVSFPLKVGIVLQSARTVAIPTSSGSGALAACLSSFSYCAISAGSTCTSGGARAGAATNSRDWLLRLGPIIRLLTRQACERARGKASRSCTEISLRLKAPHVGLGRDFKVLKVFYNQRSLIDSYSFGGK